ncbi:hypothetical protein [Mammaliicoccus sciuri]|uniref:hypothetical protein n=1 Tax=Mammaliicoccus sciuri TaxID=1296 RepID=UPI0021CE2975|nr:hypothetical protein [Mammaliicoccus sciuri]UXV31243.1 hypothetical protein MUA60_09715 [Mammaliicoccus sciuri]
MAYEHERWITHLIEHKLFTEGIDSKEETRAVDELKLVYAKAEAFDRIKIISNKYANDLSTSAEQCIDLIEDELEDRNAI